MQRKKCQEDNDKKKVAGSFCSCALNGLTCSDKKQNGSHGQGNGFSLGTDHGIHAGIIGNNPVLSKFFFRLQRKGFSTLFRRSKTKTSSLCSCDGLNHLIGRIYFSDCY